MCLPLAGSLAGAVGLSALAAGAYWLFYASHFVSTENAYAAVEIAQVTPEISGTISEVRVTDTQTVRKGDVLLVIDPADARLTLAQAEAELGRAVRRVKGYVATDSGLAAQIAAHFGAVRVFVAAMGAFATSAIWLAPKPRRKVEASAGGH